MDYQGMAILLGATGTFIVVVGGFVLNAITALKKEVVSVKTAIADVKVTTERTEINTNSLTDKLGKAIALASHAQGMQDQRTETRAADALKAEGALAAVAPKILPEPLT